MTIKMQVRGFEQIPLVKDLLRQYIVAWAAIFKRRLQEKTPVDTGRLRRSWSVRSATTKGINIGNETPYAIFVEEGTVKQAPVRMMERTIEEAEQISREAAEQVGLP
jgi:HK97 gp10 family phage protein